MNERLKQIIFNKLYKDLKNVEIIKHNESIWFIDRKEKYWYFIYKKDGTLFWRYDFFPDFFNLFSSVESEFEPIICEWVEEVLNFRVNTPKPTAFKSPAWVEEVLNCRVNTHGFPGTGGIDSVEEVLKSE